MKLRNKNRHRNSRRGITLLFVVSMIVLFLLMGTAFVVVANDYFRASRKRAKAKLHTIDRTALVHRTFYDIVRGPEVTNIVSRFRGHDLLSDQYGFGFKGYVNQTTDNNGADSSPIPVASSGGQFVQIALAGDIAGGPNDLDNAAWPLHNPTAPAPTEFLEISDLYTGLVITFTSGPAQGLSTRVYSHTFSSIDGQHYFWITPVWLDRGGVAPADLVDSEVIVNGREFSGRGAGEFLDDNNDFARDSERLGPSAVRPNRAGESLEEFRENYLGSLVNPGPLTEVGTPSRSVNEPYDAADFQNMFLSGRNAQGQLIPSFHRQTLYQYVFDNSTVPDEATRQRASFRPIPGLTANNNYPYNTQALNPSHWTTGGRSPEDDLDCDTDFDGELDSVFIDPGYGIITNPDGTKYKPLVAVRVRDLDGSINMNVHGNLTQGQADRFVNQRTQQFGGGPRFPTGQGYGPAEVDLRGFFGADYDAVNSVLATRYGVDGVPGDGGVAGKSIGKLLGYPRDSVDILNGRYGTVDRAGAFSASLYGGSPMDLNGRFSIGTPDFARVSIGGTDYSDFRDWNGNFSNGLPVIDMTVSGTSLSEFSNNPYEMSFAPLPFGDANDSPYSAIELERILRPYDMDANLLAGRLWEAPNVTGSTWSWTGEPGIREQVTTESYEVPTIPETFKITLIRYLVEEVGLTTQQAIARAESLIADDLFAPELLRGLKMDINRPFGNGYDDNSDGAVDNPAETVYNGVANAKSEKN